MCLLVEHAVQVLQHGSAQSEVSDRGHQAPETAGHFWLCYHCLLVKFAIRAD